MDWAAITYPGTREINEDSLGEAEAQGTRCFIVADGLGGHGLCRGGRGFQWGGSTGGSTQVAP